MQCITRVYGVHVPSPRGVNMFVNFQGFSKLEEHFQKNGAMIDELVSVAKVSHEYYVGKAKVLYMNLY